MKVVTLLGSAKKKGNTATALKWVEDELKSLESILENTVDHQGDEYILI